MFGAGSGEPREKNGSDGKEGDELMAAKQFYGTLLAELNIPIDEMEAARDRRRDLQKILEQEVGSRVPGTDSFGVGAIAQATQIRPLNDVDIVLRVPEAPANWADHPERAMTDVMSWIGGQVGGSCATTTHAIKITFPDEEFTADVVVGRKQEKGILLPHCPKGDSAKWIESDPQGHRDLVLGRNSRFRDHGRSIFSKQVRILKCWNLEQKLRDDRERKPLASFHVTALALRILTSPDSFERWTPRFFEEAARLVLSPLKDPSGVGDDIEALDPAYASECLKTAGEKTARALDASQEEAEEILRDVFGDPKARGAIVGKGPVSVTPGGALVGGIVAGGRAVKPVRSHGDDRT